MSRIKYFCCTLLFFPISFLASAQFSGVQQRAVILKRQVERNHYSPRAVNDSFSSEVFVKIIKELDPQQDIFTADDYNILASFRYQLDDELNGSAWKFLDVASALFKRRLQRADSLVSSILQKPLDFNSDEKITFSRGEDFRFAASVPELRSRWTKWFKFLALSSAYDEYASDSTKPLLKAVLAKKESSVREKIRKATQRSIQNLLESSVFDNFMAETYLNALATTFDPHTMFFSLQAKEDFQSELSTENYSFGFDIDETREGKIIIAQLTPGGPAWKSGELHTNDELLELQWEGKQAIDIAGSTYEEVDDILNESNHGSISVKVKKTNGAIRTITLQKEKIETEENVVKGYLLKGEKNIGYISLPDFYTTWEDEGGSGCANDVAKELIKLKKEKIDGLILDVRFNGGGSLEEALQMAGIFIDEGPLTGTKDRTGKLVFLKDPNRGTVYDGPVVLMVNGQSASASELLAAVLQDYNRAVIVGSPTYGKATMQQIFPVDTMMKNMSLESKNGYVKITTGKLYRVNGQTAQLNGVIPDVPLPDAFDVLHYREKFTPDALPADTVKRNAYYKPLLPLPFVQLLQKSNQRISSNKNFQEINESIRRETQASEKERVVPLKPELFEKWASQNKDDIASEEKEFAPSKLFTAKTYTAGDQTLPGDNYSKSINAIILKNIQQDIYIEEAYQILIDLLNLQHKN
jgi:carboxyl-terminal processing protease